MLVKQRLRMNSVVSAVSVLAILVVLLLTIYRVNRTLEASKIADGVISASFERLMLRTDLHRTGSERSKVQLIAKHGQIGDLLKAASQKFSDPEDRKTISELLANHELIGKFSKTIGENREKTGPHAQPDALSREVEDRLLSQLNMRVYESILLGNKLQESGKKAVVSSLKLAGEGIIFVLLLVGAATLINSWTMGLAITDRIQRLRKGTVVIGEGNLDHRIDVSGNDEFTELSEAFNAMTAKLRGAENRYQTLFNTLMEGFCIIEVIFDSERQPVDYRFLECNPAFEGQTGLQNAQGRLMRELAPDHEAHWFEIYGKVALTGEPASFMNEARALNRWYDVAAYRVGKPEDRQVAIVFNDITDRKRAEEALHKAHDELEHRVEEQTAEIRRANESLEQRVIERTAELRAANETLRASRMAALNLMEDALQSRQQAEKASDELQEINKELESFIYSVSHDLRAPIRAMSGFAKILNEDFAGKLDAQGQDYLDRILKGSEKSTQLINDLLHLSKISRQELDRIQIDLSKTASKVAEELREMDPGRRVEVVIQEGMTASVDPRLIELVLSNLLGNAWKFTAKTEKARIEFGKLDCGTTNASPPLPLPFKGREKGGDGSSRIADCGIKSDTANPKSEIEKTVYYVKDNGAGFDMKFADKMFWPFHRLHSEKEFEGTGIGLTIVERIIRRHGGKVWAESEVGKGAVFFFTL